MKKLCVFCGSSPGHNLEFRNEARKMGAYLAKKKIGLVYGGASVGVMGAMADGCLEAGGEVWGVIPESLMEWEVAHHGIQHLEVVDSMHERKKMMYDLSDGFMAYPGGIGTLDELCEIVTWAQIRLHKKPCYVANQRGFFNAFKQHLEHTHHEGFLRQEHLNLVPFYDNWNDAVIAFLEQEH
jgi:uncharacterized protein (TIGR00730 family)